MVQGNPLGTSVYSLEQIADGWAIGESTNIMNGMLAQTTTLKTDGSLNPRSLVQTGSMQGQQLKTDITFAGGRAKGTSMTAAQTGPKTTTVDTELPAGTLRLGCGAAGAEALSLGRGCKVHRQRV